MRLTKNFTLKELTITSVNIPNVVSCEQEGRLRTLCEKVLQPLRDLYGKPIIVSSGFRNERVNRAVGGSPTSQHVKGEAVDVTTGNRATNKLLYDLIAKHLEFDQLINEYDYLWVHVSYTTQRKNRRQQLKIG